MASIIHPLLAILASLTRQDLARQLSYLRAENQILRSSDPSESRSPNKKSGSWFGTASS